MKKKAVLLVVSLLLTHHFLWSQKKLTLSAFMGLGTSSFGGPGAVGSSVYYRSGIIPPTPPNWDSGIMANPYGKRPLTGFVAGLQADLQFPSKWILQFNSQYEYTGARLAIDSIITPTASINTDGTYTRYFDLVSINPGIGRIVFQNPSLKLILHTGFDFIINISAGNVADYRNEQDGKNYSIGGSGDKPEIADRRITAGASLKMNKVGIDINYKYGIANFNRSGTEEVYSRLLHVRLSYSFLQRSL